MEKDNKGIWVEEFTISHHYVNPKGLASLHGISYFLMEGAIGHAAYRSLGYEEMSRKNQSWVLTRQGIIIHKHLRLGDEIRLETWVHLTTESFSVRDFHIIDTEGDIAIEARTSWMIMDLTSRRPVRIDREGIERLPHHYDRLNTPIDLVKIPELENQENEHTFRVVYSDLDMNQHVNNISYVRWFMDRFEWQFHKEHLLEYFTINYIAEALFGDALTIILEQSKEDDNVYLLKIVRLSDNKEIARCLTKWKQSKITLFK
ncbi:acyl-[acyl-carrier-protein] thioesterase [Bacteroidota bacterium]